MISPDYPISICRLSQTSAIRENVDGESVIFSIVEMTINVSLVLALVQEQ